MLLSSFGKKRKITRRRKSSSKKIMYAIKRTRAGKRVVKVDTVQKGSKIVKVYASSKRPVAKSVKLFPRKSDAKSSLKKMRSSFGAKKGPVKRKVVRRRKTSMSFGAIKKASIRYGYVPCLDIDNTTYGEPKYKPYKFYKIKWNEQEYCVIVKKDKYAGTNVLLKVPEEAKRFMVKTSGTKADVKKSDFEAKEKARALSKQYTMLKSIGIDLSPVECSPADASSIASATQYSKDPFINSLRAAVKNLPAVGGSNPFNTGTQALDAKRINMARSMLNVPMKYRQNPDIFKPWSVMGQPSHPYSQSMRQRLLTKSGREVRQNPITGSMNRIVGGKDIPHVGGRSHDEDLAAYKASMNSFGLARRGRNRSLFGRRVNYGFSRFF